MKDNLVNESGGLVNDCISRQAAIDGKITAVISGQAIEAIPESYIKKLPLAQPQRWIPMSERMPENGHYYLWCSNGGNVQSDYYWDGFENGQKYGYTIVAWMPLPEPYKEGE